jgi:hypothetical protein
VTANPELLGFEVNTLVANGRTRVMSHQLAMKLATLAGYLCAVALLVLAWSTRDLNIIHPAVGLGYWLGIVGSILMLLLLVYPLRKRIKSLHKLGSVKLWFRTHMIFGVVGPVLVLIHSNFSLGSTNGRIALFCTLIVASSGIVGRYLYSKIHHGMHGQRATLDSLRTDVASESAASAGLFSVVEQISQQLAPHEQRAIERSNQIVSSVFAAFTAPLTAMRLKGRLSKLVRQEIDSKATQSAVFADHRDRLIESSDQYLVARLSAYRKFAQFSGSERLFGLWHVVHFPLFLVMVLAAIVHVIAVHAY